MMKKKGWFWTFIGLILIIIMFVSWQQWEKVNPAKAALTMPEARKLVEDRYLGNVVKINLANNVYEMELKKEKNLYKIKLDAESREIVSFKKIKANTEKTVETVPKELTEEEIKNIVLATANGTIISFEKLESNKAPIYKAEIKEATQQTTITVDALTGKVLSNTSVAIIEPPKRLTEEEAQQIAQKQVNGVVDHLEIETRGDVTYYLAKLKTQDDQEAIVQIHAITGQVMSVSWDDKKGRGKGKIEDD
jgi:uncharacterized membrane protein YkoI